MDDYEDEQRNLAWAAQAAEFCKIHGYVQGTRRWTLLDLEVKQIAQDFPGGENFNEQYGDDVLERAHANLVADGLAPVRSGVAK